MELKELGFDLWFRGKQEALQSPDCGVARVTAVNRDNYLVRNERCEVPAELSGRLLFGVVSSAELPCVGDWVFVRYHNSGTLAIIHDLFPRKSILRRKAAGRKIDYQMIAANIDVAFIVQSCDFDFNLRRLERYLVMVHEGRIEPILLLTKSDLVTREELEQRISEIGRSSIRCKTIALSNRTGFGLDQINQVLEPGKTYCLIGSSGVGKTTLLNRLIGRDLFETKEVRENDGRGRHATARRQLIVLDQGAMLIDTPGMRELGNIGVDGGIDESFFDVRELARHCRFTNCTHTGETGCSVQKAIEDGKLDQDRFRSYLKLLRESEYHQMSYVEKRKKDRQFGRFIKSAMKQMKQRKMG
jgi:ribosome biogenesis GTPase